MGVITVEETEKPAKIIPIQIPVAPRFSAYKGNNGATMPTPSMEEKMDRPSMGKAFFIIWVSQALA